MIEAPEWAFGESTDTRTAGAHGPGWDEHGIFGGHGLLICMLWLDESDGCTVEFTAEESRARASQTCKKKKRDN